MCGMAGGGMPGMGGGCSAGGVQAGCGAGAAAGADGAALACNSLSCEPEMMRVNSPWPETGAAGRGAMTCGTPGVDGANG
jgi:hypothetical protein